MILRLNKVLMRKTRGRFISKIFHLKSKHWEQLYEELRNLARNKNDLPVVNEVMNLMFRGVEIKVK